jgi:hypothetical protein
MPPILVAFFILIGATTGPPVVKGLITPKDPTSRSKIGKPAPDEYRTWTSRPWIAVSDRETRACDATFFALSTARRPVRLIAGGAEQILDTSWSFERRLREGERRTVAFDFRNPEGGASLSCQEQTLTCYPANGIAAQTEVVEGRCAPLPKAPRRKAEKQALVGHAPPFVPIDLGIGGAYVDVTFEIQGVISEEWYCPAITVYWPEGAESVRESDCATFPGDPDYRFRWPFNHGFPGGEWNVKACIAKSGRQLACTVVKVRVVGGDLSGTPP